MFFVETKGRTLEELDAVFEAKNPRKASTAESSSFRRCFRAHTSALSRPKGLPWRKGKPPKASPRVT